MKNLYISRYFALAIVVLTSALAINAEIPPQPKNANELVYDYAHVIDSANLAVINDSLKNLYIYNKTQVVVLTVESLDGMEIEDYCQEVFQKWGIGDKKLNNGVLIVVKPKTETSTPSMKGEYPQDVASFLKEKQEEKKRDAWIAVIVYGILYILLCGLIWYFFFMPTKNDWYSIMASPLIAATITPSSGRRYSGGSSGSSWSSGRSSGSSWSSGSSSSSSSSWSWGGGSSGGGGASSSW